MPRRRYLITLCRAAPVDRFLFSNSQNPLNPGESFVSEGTDASFDRSFFDIDPAFTSGAIDGLFASDFSPPLNPSTGLELDPTGVNDSYPRTNKRGYDLVDDFMMDYKKKKSNNPNDPVLAQKLDEIAALLFEEPTGQPQFNSLDAHPVEDLDELNHCTPPTTYPNYRWRHPPTSSRQPPLLKTSARVPCPPTPSTISNPSQTRTSTLSRDPHPPRTGLRNHSPGYNSRSWRPNSRLRRRVTSRSLPRSLHQRQRCGLGTSCRDSSQFHGPYRQQRCPRRQPPRSCHKNNNSKRTPTTHRKWNTLAHCICRCCSPSRCSRRRLNLPSRRPLPLPLPQQQVHRHRQRPRALHHLNPPAPPAPPQQPNPPTAPTRF
ncbi:uncharacterized protein EV422DRAFT_194908 [Fimicolochytrium jonesii]|uniref:uncharacterized protein n=1 Tax=Fimicolochytrium jonesii TaxID=1396493 RepID=UPI0022FEE3D7|nr:uncharacterized protein EV422DRAFT_194908 [Fimicolochytrium jonesii]KAI8818224.1 hypothetical protein EV422DRAFT_194908 [Fimicolochytrium jonesii]